MTFEQLNLYVTAIVFKNISIASFFFTVFTFFSLFLSLSPVIVTPSCPSIPLFIQTPTQSLQSPSLKA